MQSKSKYIIKFAADATAADVDAFCAALKDTTSACTALPTAPGAVAASVANETEALTLDVGGPVLLVPLTLSSNTTLQMIQDLGGSKLSFMEVRADCHYEQMLLFGRVLLASCAPGSQQPLEHARLHADLL